MLVSVDVLRLTDTFLLRSDECLKSPDQIDAGAAIIDFAGDGIGRLEDSKLIVAGAAAHRVAAGATEHDIELCAAGDRIVAGTSVDIVPERAAGELVVAAAAAEGITVVSAGDGVGAGAPVDGELLSDARPR